MCKAGKWLLAAFVFTAVSQVAADDVRLKEISSNVLDDMYQGCRSQAMEKVFSSGLLETELRQDEAFQKKWNAYANCSKQIPGGKHEHSVAISAYTDGTQDFQLSFDNAVETMGGNISTYTDHFHFKSLYFLLMDSMMLVNPAKCMPTYALTDEDDAPQIGSTLTFGRFITVYSDIKNLERDSDLFDRIVLKITTCFFVNLETHSCSKQKKKLLLSPAERFTVADVKHVEDENNDYTLVVLNHLKLHSEHNCYIFSGAPAVLSTLWFVPVFLALTGFFNC
ncbi:ecto-ADP-ribosyltransferase 5-like [Parambassis ranga]|uniref:NAD(P)(+)--arginine ADP-ribosyltransferase n=1 Tax=Parambassis ranga TaxID=210632 RepID=A0A6P7I2Y7_9TELE|nr:ecto-ADP-ribosyltransferase 5-like [Parambassis ranga]